MSIKHLLTFLFLTVGTISYAQQSNCYDNAVADIQEYYQKGKIKEAKEYVKNMEQLCDGQPTSAFLTLKDKVYIYMVEASYNQKDYINAFDLLKKESNNLRQEKSDEWVQTICDKLYQEAEALFKDGKYDDLNKRFKKVSANDFGRSVYGNGTQLLPQKSEGYKILAEKTNQINKLIADKDKAKRSEQHSEMEKLLLSINEKNPDDRGIMEELRIFYRDLGDYYAQRNGWVQAKSNYLLAQKYSNTSDSKITNAVAECERRIAEDKAKQVQTRIIAERKDRAYNLNFGIVGDLGGGWINSKDNLKFVGKVGFGAKLMLTNYRRVVGFEMGAYYQKHRLDKEGESNATVITEYLKINPNIRLNIAQDIEISDHEFDLGCVFGYSYQLPLSVRMKNDFYGILINEKKYINALNTLNAGIMIGEIDNHWELGFNYEHSLSNIFKPNQPYTHNGQALMLFPNNSSKFGTLSFYFAITF